MTKETANEILTNIKKNFITEIKYEGRVLGPSTKDYDRCYQVIVTIHSFGISYQDIKKIYKAAKINSNSYYRSEFLACNIFANNDGQHMNIIWI